MTGILRESQIGWSQHRNCAPDGNDGCPSSSKMAAGRANRALDEAFYDTAFAQDIASAPWTAHQCASRSAASRSRT
jgi:hypothetical protein